jgi:hypothetical protein
MRSPRQEAAHRHPPQVRAAPWDDPNNAFAFPPARLPSRAYTTRIRDDERPTALEEMLTAAGVAALLNVDVGFVYEHAAELNAYRLGSGPRARLRFKRSDVESWLASCSMNRESDEGRGATVEPIQRRRKGPGLGASVDLLPIRGRRDAA